jgi:hypothetical protein
MALLARFVIYFHPASHRPVHWSRRYPQLPVLRDRHPIPSRLLPVIYQSFFVFYFFFLRVTSLNAGMSLLCI